MLSIERLIVCAAMSVVAGSALAQGPIHRWSFDEAAGSTAFDTGSGPAADGALGPGAIRIPGVIGSGAVRFNAFDLNGYVNMPASASALGTSDFTVSFWMQKTPSSRFGELVGTRGGFGSCGNYLDFRGSDTGISLEISQDTGCTGYMGMGSGFGISDGAWHQVTGVRAGPSAWLYVDGVLATSATAADGVTANLTAIFPFTVGVNDVVRTFPELNCGCSFDDVRIYNRALSPFEIAFPAGKLDILLATIEGLGLPHGIANSLAAKVRAAQGYLAAGDTADAIAALGALQNELAAQSDKHVPAVQAGQLTDMAQAIIDQLLGN